MPVQIRGDKLFGPGCYDMKGGLVQFLFALRALHQRGCSPPFDPFLLVNSDEEVGSIESGRILHRLAPHMARCLVSEPSLGPEGRLKTARKGVASYTVTITGVPAHAGLDPGRGASAILELAHLIQQLDALNDAARGVSVNVGLIQGGLRANVVAPESRAVIDVRVPSQQEADRIDQSIRSLRPHLAGVSWQIEGKMGRPPLEPTPRNQALWRRAQRLGQALGLHLQQGLAGGGSDGSTASLYCATLDGLGPVGGGAHAHDEFVAIDSLPERTALLAMLLMEREGEPS
jgi:glutamate carboxypeptidase